LGVPNTGVFTSLGGKSAAVASASSEQQAKEFLLKVTSRDAIYWHVPSLKQSRGRKIPVFNLGEKPVIVKDIFVLGNYGKACCLIFRLVIQTLDRSWKPKLLI
jgi:hypothetical protein